MDHVAITTIAADRVRPSADSAADAAGADNVNFNYLDHRPSRTEGALQSAIDFYHTTTTDGAHHKLRFAKRVWNLMRNIAINVTVEPILFLYSFGMMVSSPVYSFMMMDKLCQQYCGFSVEQCQAYGSGRNDTVDNEAKNAWAQYDNYSTIIGTLPVIIYALFMGPWSDVFGRKKPMAISFVGTSLGNIITILLYFVPSMPVWMVILPNLLTSSTGGITSLIMSACAYAADISQSSNSRTIRFALYDVSLSFGIAIGGVLSGVLVDKNVPYYVCYCISLASTSTGEQKASCFVFISVNAALTKMSARSYEKGLRIILIKSQRFFSHALTALLLVLFRVHDVPKMADQVRSTTMWKAFGSLFTTSHIRASYKTLTKPRSGRARRCIWLVLLAFLIVFTTEMGEIQLIQKFFTSAPLRWSLSFFIFYTSIFEFGCMATAGIFIPSVKKFFSWRDTTFFIVACVSRIIYCWGISIMNTEWAAYVFSVFDLLDYGVIIGPRCVLSKLVSDDEQGKMLSLYAACEAVSPLLGSVIGTAIFTATTESWPGFFGVAEAYGMLVVLALVVLVDHLIRSDEQRLHPDKMNEVKADSADESKNHRTS